MDISHIKSLITWRVPSSSGPDPSSRIFRVFFMEGKGLGTRLVGAWLSRDVDSSNPFFYLSLSRVCLPPHPLPLSLTLCPCTVQWNPLHQLDQRDLMVCCACVVCEWMNFFFYERCINISQQLGNWVNNLETGSISPVVVFKALIWLVEINNRNTSYPSLVPRRLGGGKTPGDSVYTFLSLPESW